VDPAKDERRARKQAAALSLRDHVGEPFHAVISGTSRNATWLRIMPSEIEGRLVRGRRGLSVGTEVDVVLLAVDPNRGFIDFARADTLLSTN
jgi:ribonuclease R